MRIVVLSQLCESLKLRVNGRKRGQHNPTEELALEECTNVESSDDAEVVGTAPECKPEVDVLLLIGVGDFSARKNNFEVLYIVADEAVSSAEV